MNPKTAERQVATLCLLILASPSNPIPSPQRWAGSKPGHGSRGLTSVRKVAHYVLSANPPCNPRDSLRGVLCGFCGGLLVGTRAGEDAGERRVPLVTGVFVDRA